MSTSKPPVSAMDLSAWEKVQFNETVEEKNKRIEDEKTSGQEIFKRKKRLEHLIEKRKRNFQYIKDLHQGKNTYTLEERRYKVTYTSFLHSPVLRYHGVTLMP